MPLSEHEQRVLEQMEQALYAEDPRFAHQMVGKTRARAQRRKAALGVLAAIAGLALVISAVLLQQIWIGGLGFAAMVLGGVWAFTPTRVKTTLAAVDSGGNVTLRGNHPSMGKGGKGSKGARRMRGSSSGRSSPGGSTGSTGSFMQRMEQRWDKRREQGPS